MDPTDESTKDLLPAYLSDKSYLVARPEGEKLLTSPVARADANMLRVESDGTLDAQGDALLTTSFALGGINDTAVRHSLLKKTPEERRRWFEAVWRNVAAGAELLSLEILPADLRDTETPLSAKTVVRLPEVLRRGRTRDALNLPLATCALSVANGILDENTALEKRRFPLVLPCTAGTEETLRLVLDETLGAVRTLPAAADVHAGAFSFTRTVACSNGVLTACRRMRVDDVNFDVPAYTALRNARKDVETAEREEVLFASRADAGAHVRIRQETLVLHVVSPHAWTSTNTVEKEILTYRGKQTSSELKFSYAPCTRAVDLVSATISNRNGKVYSITPKEVNLMDCGWAASAPRYPASKMLVANLPGVEIGSVVRYVVARTVTNAPVAEAFAYVFGGRNPTDFERLEIHVPDGVEFRSLQKRMPKDAYTVTTNAGERVFAWTMRAVPREPEESAQPPSARWRPSVSVSFADWEAYGHSLVHSLEKVRSATDASRVVPLPCVGCEGAPAARITAIRKFLRRIRVVGPGLLDRKSVV